jgi:hypothetical protein
MTDRELLLAEIDAEIMKFEEVAYESIFGERMMKEVDLDLSIRESAAGTAYAMTEVAEMVEEIPVVPVEIVEPETVAEEVTEATVEPAIDVEFEEVKEEEKALPADAGVAVVPSILDRIISSGALKGYKGDRKEVVMAVAAAASVVKPANYPEMRKIVEDVMKARGEETSYFKLQNFTDGFLKKLNGLAITWGGKSKSPIFWNWA